MNKIVAIIIKYSKNKKFNLKKIHSIQQQVDKIFIIDNSPKEACYRKNKKIDYFFLGENYGISYAQNFGIFQALKNFYTHCILVDQDTSFEKNYIKQAIKIYKTNKNITAIAPNLFDQNKKIELGLVKRFFLFKKNINSLYEKKKNIVNILKKTTSITYITETMSSGTIIKLKDISTVGFMNDDLFLDWVDFEWCWRLRKYNKFIVGLSEIFAFHHLGSSKIKFLFKIYHTHSLLRYCYILRNGIALSLYSSSAPISWRINIFVNTVRYFLGSIILNKFNPKQVVILLKALKEGFLCRGGKIKI